MFRSKRSNLVKRLWKHKALKNETDSSHETVEELELKSVAQSLMKRMKESELEALLAAIETHGDEHKPCILLPHALVQLGKRKVAPHHLCCQMWRWPDLECEATMRHLPCRNHTDSTDVDSVCCNPFHWSRVILPDPEMASVKSLLSSKEEELLMDNQTHSEFSVLGESPRNVNHELTSTETGGTPSTLRLTSDGDSSSSSGRTFWCNVAYWEHRDRVGRLFSVFEPHVHIFQRLPLGGGMCLALLQSPSAVDSVRRTRDKIGLGLVLSQEDGAVWVYNRSDYPIFVNSPTLDLPHSPALVVKKVPPGHSLLIHEPRLLDTLARSRDPQLLDGPFDPNAVRISFAKGWGPHYSRQFITSCPCWIEILLHVNR